MFKTIKRLAAAFLIAVLVAGMVPAVNTEAVAITLKKPGNCRFVKWNNYSFTGCRIAWNKVSGANIYAIVVSWTDGSHETIEVTDKTYFDVKGLKNNHVYQAQIMACYYDKKIEDITKASPLSNVAYITPSPSTCTGKLVNPKSKTYKEKLKWNIIYGCNGYNVFLATNPKGTWYWNQSTATKATATSAEISKYRGSKLKKYTNYYVRIVTRRKRNGVFCTVPMPSNNYYLGWFRIY